jgi:hypothetical protein
MAGIFERLRPSDLVRAGDPPFRWAVAEYIAGQLAPVQEVRGGGVLDLFEYGDQLVSTGWFVSIGGAAAHGVAALDAGGEWTPLTGGNGVDACGRT